MADIQDGAYDGKNDDSVEVTPVNYIHISRKVNAVKGSWIVDPTLIYPEDFLPPLTPGTRRNNVELIAESGYIDADIFLYPSESKDAPWVQGQSERTMIKTNSPSAASIVRIHDLPAEGNRTRRPFHAICSSSNMYTITVQLPLSFTGPVTLTASSISYSEQVKKQVNILSEVDGVIRAFIGLFKPSEWRGGWNGDKLEVQTPGSVRILFDLEPEENLANETMVVAQHPHSNVYFEIAKDGNPMGRMVFKLYDHAAPKTCQNFRLLATGERGFGYTGTTFHWVFSDYIGGGDFTGSNGSGGRSALGTDSFIPETTSLSHNKAGILSMYRSSKLSTSVFLIMNGPRTGWDKLYNVFGEVVQGLDILEKICGEGQGTKRYAISKSGLL